MYQSWLETHFPYVYVRVNAYVCAHGAYIAGDVPSDIKAKKQDWNSAGYFSEAPLSQFGGKKVMKGVSTFTHIKLCL